jgi:hypothetical protein
MAYKIKNKKEKKQREYGFIDDSNPERKFKIKVIKEKDRDKTYEKALDKLYSKIGKNEDITNYSVYSEKDK